MENKTKWYRDPDVITKIIAVAFLGAAGMLYTFFSLRIFFDKTLKLAISGNVNALAEYLRSFGPWAIVISFLTGCVHQCGQYFSFNFSFDG